MATNVSMFDVHTVDNVLKVLEDGTRIGAMLPEAWIAGGIAAGLIAISFLITRQFLSRVKHLLTDQGPLHPEGLGAELGPIMRHGLTALLLAIEIFAWPWNGIASLLIGFPLAIATALTVSALLRGLSLPRWVIIPAAMFIFISLLSYSVGGLTPIANMMDRIGFNLGSRRVSLLGLFSVAVTAVALLACVRLANRVVSHTIMRARGFDPTQKLLAEKLSAITVIVAAFFVGIDILGIDLTAFAVFSGALGLAVGFGLQKTFGNLIAGIILLMDRSIKPGDVIAVGDSFGWVNKIGVRAVSVITRDGKEHLIPNENLMTMEVENWSYSDRNVRIRIPVGVSYHSDIELAQKLMLQAAVESPRVLKSPEPRVQLLNFGDSSVDHEIRMWISDPEGGIGNARSDVLNRCWRLFRENGIEIPFPQRDIWLRNPEALPGNNHSTPSK